MTLPLADLLRAIHPRGLDTSGGRVRAWRAVRRIWSPLNARQKASQCDPPRAVLRLRFALLRPGTERQNHVLSSFDFFAIGVGGRYQQPQPASVHVDKKLAALGLLCLKRRP